MSTLTVNLIVPASGDGPIADISNLVGEKTVVLTGSFAGSYALLVSDDGSNFVPALSFDAGGLEGIKQTISAAFRFARVRAQAFPQGVVTMSVTGIAGPTQNFFGTLATVAPGAGGLQPVIDTALLFPPSGLEGEIAILCRGGFAGNVVVLGSKDGVAWNPVGEFEASPMQRNLLGGGQILEFSPLFTPDLVRYLRIDVQGVVSATTVVTIGGRISEPLYSGDEIPTIEEEAARSTTLQAPAGGEILYEWTVDFNGLGVGTPLAPVISFILNTQGDVGTVSLYIGATNPGNTAGAALVFTTTTSTLSETKIWAGTMLANPGGVQLVQLVMEMASPTTDIGIIRAVGIKW